MNQPNIDYAKLFNILSAAGTLLDAGLDSAATLGVASQIIAAKKAATPEGGTETPYTEAELQPIADLFTQVDADLSAAIAKKKAEEQASAKK